MPTQLDLFSWDSTGRRTFYVYVIENSVNAKLYFGKTNDLAVRWRRHVNDSKRGDQLLYRAMRKYGVEAFSMRKVFECSLEDESLGMEMFYIEHFESLAPRGYNMTIGGESGRVAGEWATLEDLRAAMATFQREHGRKIKAKEYSALKRSMGERLCDFTHFTRTYGLTFAEVRDGERGTGKSWTTETEIRAKMDEWAAAHGRKIEQDEYNKERRVWGSLYPYSGMMPRIAQYGGKTFAEIRDGERGYGRKWKTAREMHRLMQEWQAANGRKLTQLQYTKVRSEWPSGCPSAPMMMEVCGLWFGAIRDGLGLPDDAG